MGVAEVLFAVLTALMVPVLVIGLIVWAIARAARDDEPADDPGIGTVRRIFLYGLASISLALAASGLALLLGGILDALLGDTVVAASDTELATALSLTVVGLPAWLIFNRLAERAVRTQPVERRSLARWTYLLVVRGVALTTAVFTAIEVGQALLGIESFSGTEWGWLVVALGVWAFHQRFIAADGAPTGATRFLDRMYLAYASVLGLYLLAAGLLTLLIEPASYAYDTVFRSHLVLAGDWSEGLRRGAIVVLAGGVTWWWHWWARLRGSQVTNLWHVVVFLFGIFAGVATAVGSAGTAVYTVLSWLLGATPGTDEAQHFSVLIPSAAFFLVGTAGWLYHRAVLEERQADVASNDPARLYRYLVAAAGLVALSGAVASAFALAIDGFIPAQELIRPGDWWRDQLAVTLTLAIVGAPLWWLAWSAAQRAVTREGDEERASLPRRAYVSIVFGIAVLVTLGNLAALLFVAFDAALGGDFTRETLRDMRWSVAALLTAGAVAGYHWLVLRDDRTDEEPAPAAPLTAPPAMPADGPSASGAEPAVTPARRPAARTVTVVASAGVLDAVASRLDGAGIPARRLQRLDGEAAPVPGDFAALLDALPDRVTALDAGEVLVIVGRDSIEVWPVAPGGGAPA